MCPSELNASVLPRAVVGDDPGGVQRRGGGVERAAACGGVGPDPLRSQGVGERANVTTAAATREKIAEASVSSWAASASRASRMAFPLLHERN